MIAILGAILLASHAQAVPTAYYNPANGHIQLANDVSALAAVALKSSTEQFSTSTAAYAEVPGALVVLDEVPAYVAYVPFPTGSFSLGNIVTPGTPISDLSGQYFFQLLDGDFRVTFIAVPEPSAATLVGVTAIALGMQRRKKKPRGEPCG